VADIAQSPHVDVPSVPPLIRHVEAATLGGAGGTPAISASYSQTASETPPAVTDARWQLFTSRVIDIGVSVLLLLALLPVLLVIGVVVRLTSSGPAIYKQERVGQGGRAFRMWKFRTMADGTHTQVLNDPELRRQYEQNDFKLQAQDPRITKIGRILRKTSVDELPQLVNIIRGDMALVGVRPIERAQLVLRPELDQALYCRYRPGVTGVWQVEGRSTIKATNRLLLDRRQVEQWSLGRNLLLLLRTPAAVLGLRGAH
jgi:lipopolysaccharide/colanic/teichoic acid biosynthesis glycosyltransferase